MGSVGRAWGCVLATYRSYGLCWTGFGAVCWQPRSYGLCWPGLGLYVGNLHVLWTLLALLDRFDLQVLWALLDGLGAVCWQPTGLMGSVGPGLGLYVGNLGLMGSVGPVWGCMLATYMSYVLCWTGFGAVCWQPTGLMCSVGPGLGLYVGNLQVLCALLDRASALYAGNLQVLWLLWALLVRVWGCMLLDR